MNLLYLSCHEVLEFDELRLLMKIPNLNVFSPGAYWNPGDGCSTRPPLNIHYPQEWKEAWNTITPTDDLPDHKYHLNPESVEPFDTIVVMHNWDWIFMNWDVIKNKRVIWRDIGQTNSEDEEACIRKAVDLGVEIVRYWGGYKARDNYQGHNAIIPFGKYKEDFPQWQGSKHTVMGICQSIKAREDSCRYSCWEESTKGLSRSMYGRSNEDLPCWGGPSEYGQVIEALVAHNAFWYGGTSPAPYTLALMEAMFVGIPVFTVKQPGWESAVTELVHDYGLCDDSQEMRSKIEFALSADKSLMAMFANEQRNKAIAKWDSTQIIPLWRKYLGL